MRVVSPKGVVVNVSEEKAKRLGWPVHVEPKAEPKKPAKSKK